jgi:hypothetical protein
MSGDEELAVKTLEVTVLVVFGLFPSARAQRA